MKYLNSLSTETLFKYYLDAMEYNSDTKIQLPEMVFSTPIVFSDMETLSIAYQGDVDIDKICQFVSSYVVIGYADNQPFAIFCVALDEDKEYYLRAVIPSLEKTAGYHILLQQESVFLTSPLSSKTVYYISASETKELSYHSFNMDTKEIKEIYSATKDVQTYHYAAF